MKKILLIRTDKIGDIVLTTPIIKIVRDHYPKSHIAFLTGPKTKDLVDGNPYLNEVIVYDKYQKHKNIFKTIQFSLALKKKKFDVVLIFNPSNRAHWISWLAHIPMRIGYQRKSGFLLTHSFEDKKGEGLKPESFYNEDLLSILGIPLQHSKELYVPIAQISPARVAPRDRNFVVINTSAGCPSKIWPAQNFAHLAMLIYQKLHLNIVLIGSSKECQKVQSLSNVPLTILSEHLNLKELALLFKKSFLHISSDTGPVQIASAVKTPTIIIFGRSLPGLGPKRWLPLANNIQYFHKNIGCDPCLAHNCQLDFDCLKTIKVEEVFYVVQRYAKNINR